MTEPGKYAYKRKLVIKYEMGFGEQGDVPSIFLGVASPIQDYQGIKMPKAEFPRWPSTC